MPFKYWPPCHPGCFPMCKGPLQFLSFIILPFRAFTETITFVLTLQIVEGPWNNNWCFFTIFKPFHSGANNSVVCIVSDWLIFSLDFHIGRHPILLAILAVLSVIEIVSFAIVLANLMEVALTSTLNISQVVCFAWEFNLSITFS